MQFEERFAREDMACGHIIMGVETRWYTVVQLFRFEEWISVEPLSDMLNGSSPTAGTDTSGVGGTPCPLTTDAWDIVLWLVPSNISIYVSCIVGPKYILLNSRVCY